MIRLYNIKETLQEFYPKHEENKMKDEDVQKFIIGLTIVILITRFLKNILKISRPKKSSTYGMPSSKSSTLFYIIVFLLLFNKLSKETILIMIASILICCGIKYYSKEHSMFQLLVGAILGLSIAYIVYLVFTAVEGPPKRVSTAIDR